MRSNFLHQPYYCEENIWQLAKQLNEDKGEVWFILNSNQAIATAQQRAVAPDSFIVWDYHVIYYSSKEGIFDLDTRCPFPCPVEAYLKASFLDIASAIPKEYAPDFRIIPASEYLTLFASSREHMLDKKGCYLQPPPDWQTIGEGHNLDSFIDYHHQQIGQLFSLDELLRRVT